MLKDVAEFWVDASVPVEGQSCRAATFWRTAHERAGSGLAEDVVFAGQLAEVAAAVHDHAWGTLPGDIISVDTLQGAVVVGDAQVFPAVAVLGEAG